MEKKTVKIACKGAGTMGLPLLTALQGDLKTLHKDDYEKLKKEIAEDGFSFPVAVWEDPKQAKIYILDGHQRVATLQKMKDDGWVIPEIPVVLVEAKDIKQAKHKLLAAASQYGTVNEEGFLKFIGSINIDQEALVSNFRFPEIDLIDLFKDVDGSVADDEEETAVATVAMRSASDQVRQVQLFFNGKNHPEFLEKCSALQSKFGTTSLTDTVMEAIREAHKGIKNRTTVRRPKGRRN